MTPRTTTPVMHVALLRGIDAGKAKRVGMAELRALCESLGYGHVQTLLNSGNIVFSAPRADPKAAARIEKEIASQLGVQSRVLVITASDSMRSWRRIHCRSVTPAHRAFSSQC